MPTPRKIAGLWRQPRSRTARDPTAPFGKLPWRRSHRRRSGARATRVTLPDAASAGGSQMDEIEIRVVWKGKKAKMVLREEDEGISGYIDGKTRVLTLEVDDSEDEPTTTETFHHKDLE